jgi:DNA-binding beta-propeller fold protein YncE
VRSASNGIGNWSFMRTRPGLSLLVLAMMPFALPVLATSSDDSLKQAHAATPPAISEAVVVRGSDDFASFNQPLGVAIDTAHGEIYVANSGFGRIDVYSFTGRLKSQIAHFVKSADGQQVQGIPGAVAVDARGRLFVVDAKDRGVDVVDFRGRVIGRLEVRSPAGGPLWPAAVAITPDGRVFVATGGDSGRVHMFSTSLVPLGSWGEPGAGPGRLSNITAMTATPDGKLVITRSDDDPMVQVFTPEGVFVRGFGALANGPGNFSSPTGVTVTPDGRIWVCDQVRQSLEIFDSSGEHLASLGSPGRHAGQFNYPHAVASDARGHMAITERLGARLQIWSIK